jgi:hypothetical protein
MRMGQESCLRSYLNGCYQGKENEKIHGEMKECDRSWRITAEDAMDMN